MRQRYEFAISMARQAGAIALEKLQDLRDGVIEIETKNVLDFVTSADRDVETFIRQAISDRFPHDGIVGEEFAPTGQESAIKWVIDPIDGTANFVRDLDNWGISIACICEDTCQIGIVFDPSKNVMFHAFKGHGAYRDTKHLKPRDANQLPPPNPMMILGLSNRISLASYFKTITHLTENAIEYRRFGSAAIGLAQVAEGKANGYFEADLNPWDCLAGLLLNEEAGNLIVQGGKIQSTLRNGPVLVVHPFLETTIQTLTGFDEVERNPKA